MKTRLLTKLAAVALATLGLVLSTPACTTEGFCFANCNGEDGNGGKGGGGGGIPDDSGVIIPTDGGCQGPNCNTGGGQGTGGAPPIDCTPTNAGREICDGKDNDCDGQIDENGTPPDGIDFTSAVTCGNCDTNCTDPNVLKSVVTPLCKPPKSGLGTKAGTCDYDTCAPDHYDVDGDRTNGCEYGCPWNPGGVNKKDLGGAFGCGRDDDCNGKVDDGIDFCADPENCGACGFRCSLPNTVTARCATTATNGDCNANNTACVVEVCADGFVDANGSPTDGCEYPCVKTNNGVEICDGKDNDCDGLFDNADPSLADPALNVTCYGGDKGECAAQAHAGIMKCIDGVASCCDVGSNNLNAELPRYPDKDIRNNVCQAVDPPYVLVPGEAQETCNNKDDDCDGQTDGATVDSNAPCGSSLGTCRPGLTGCLAGVLTCIGSTPKDPAGEKCDGLDNDCDGVIDYTAPPAKIACTGDGDCTSNAPYLACIQLTADTSNKGCVALPADIVNGSTGAPLTCDESPPPPTGATQPCRPGTRACFGGVPVCQGSVKKPSDIDRCFEDTNCDGVLTNQSGLTNADPKNCGACGNDCNAGNPNASFQCQAGKCVSNGCQPGHIECGGSSPSDCETACIFEQSTELCDGRDNDCDCQVDEGVVPPSPIQACGVSAAATDPGCTGAVAIACQNGVFKCTFTDPAYCTGGNCQATPDICDGKDNNCDGVVDEGFRPPTLLVGFLGQACFSDDGKPAPGDGPCRSQGAFVCRPDGTGTMCSAAKDTSKATAETCDGVDNDCNGTVDDPAAILTNDSRLGKQCFGGTKGVCALPANAGSTSCVTGSVVCSGANIVRPGDRRETCNGADDDCSGAVDDNLTDTGGFCGSGVGQCKTGTQQCVTGALSCVGSVGPQPEICDGLDNNCNGQIDESPTDVGTACNVPPAPPTGVPQPCKPGVFACIGGSRVCQGSTPPASTTDNCNEDTNCDGKLTNQAGLTNSDVLNCGACGNDCTKIDANSNWACQSGTCVKTSCKAGHIDCDGNANNCERACTPTSSTETCNGIDDNCNCQIDDNLPAVTSVQVCGVSPAATDAGCTTGVVAACVSGAYKCTFPAGYCLGGNCSTTVDLCDGKDNDCDGVADENFKPPFLTSGFLGQTCSTPAADGPCQGTGAYVCNAGGTATQCSAVKDNTKSSPELCDGIDNNCNGTVDDNTQANDSRVNKQCFGGTQGECAAVSHAGTTACQSGAVVCTGANILKPGAQAETCNGKDDDCNGVVDNTPTDVGGACGSGVGACTPGTYVCTSGARVCQGGTTAKPETCNGIDDDCNGVIDNSPTDVGGDCNVPVATPPPTAQCSVVTSPCKKGTLACSGGVKICQNSVTATSSTPDGCCQDSNCDGTLTSQPNFQTDVSNCGGCGIDCNALGAGKHGIWSCQAGACVRTACANGFINCDGVASDCERACPFSGTELCNGVDDNCDCTIDNLDTAVTPIPSPSQVCGVSSSASDPKCLAGDGTSGVKVQCSSGAWQCTFPTGYCDQGNPKSCTSTPDICDNGKDNNCNGASDESYKPPARTTGYLGQPCASDDGKAAPGDGQCRTTGTFVCASSTTTSCNAVKNTSLAGQELCDAIDNDCDGSVDEPFSAKGTNTTFYVKPAVVEVVTGSLWMYQYEASRPSATTSAPGSGNGYYCTGAGCTGGVTAAPAGVTLDKTTACSVSNKIPWFNVTPTEVEQSCQARGGFICPTTNWTTACQAGASCNWGYATGCTSPAVYTSTPFCNLGGYDFDRNATTPDTDGLLPTGSSLLQGCYAKYGAGAATSLLDITGNLREITKRGANDYPLMGGAFSTSAEDGAQCTFNFYSVATTFKFFDTGFRCCFSSNPSPP